MRNDERFALDMLTNMNSQEIASVMAEFTSDGDAGLNTMFAKLLATVIHEETGLVGNELYERTVSMIEEFSK